MTKRYILLLLTLIICACNKSNEPSPEPDFPQCKITSIKEDNDPTSTYTYNSSGQVSQVTNVYGFGNGAFSYQSGSTTFTSANTGVRETVITDAAGNILSDQYDNYKYNLDGYLIEKTPKNTATPEYIMSYSNGNLIEIVTNLGEITNIMYYDGEPNVNLLGYENPLWSNLLFNQHTFSNITATMIGKSSKNLVKGIMMTRTVDGVPEKFTNSYSYKKDQEGRVITLTIEYSAPSSYYNGVNNINFTYQCK
jgi:YD repeat-containing protein